MECVNGRDGFQLGGMQGSEVENYRETVKRLPWWQSERQLCTAVCSEAIFQGPEGSGGRASRHVHLSVIYEVWQWKELWDRWEKVQ